MKNMVKINLFTIRRSHIALVLTPTLISITINCFLDEKILPPHPLEMIFFKIPFAYFGPTLFCAETRYTLSNYPHTDNNP
jgi:hypothetical protein